MRPRPCTFGNRYDDPQGIYRVLYASTQRVVTFVECPDGPDEDLIPGGGGAELIDDLGSTHDDGRWHIVDGDDVLATYADHQVRLSLSWKAKVYADEAERARAEAGADGVTHPLGEIGLAESQELVGERVGPEALQEAGDIECVAADLSRVPLSADAFADAELHRDER